MPWWLATVALQRQIEREAGEAAKGRSAGLRNGMAAMKKYQVLSRAAASATCLLDGVALWFWLRCCALP